MHGFMRSWSTLSCYSILRKWYWLTRLKDEYTAKAHLEVHSQTLVFPPVGMGVGRGELGPSLDFEIFKKRLFS